MNGVGVALWADKWIGLQQTIVFYSKFTVSMYFTDYKDQ